MDFIDESFSQLSEATKKNLPPGLFTNLLAEGIIAGLGGIVIFIPQIAFLFLFIAVLEETGYMSRVVFLMDRGLRKYGLSGKSVIPLISGTACAIPAVMATRNIENWKERLITILVTPFTTCFCPLTRLPYFDFAGDSRRNLSRNGISRLDPYGTLFTRLCYGPIICRYFK